MKNPTCYLCGKPSARDDESKDHVPPKQFCASDIRRKYKPLNLRTLPAHKACNQAYKLDEEYFLASLGPLAMETTAGRPLFADVIARGQNEKSGRALAMQVMSEFSDRSPAGVILPGFVSKRFDAERVARVVWKIVRGLYHIEFDGYLPEDTYHWIGNATDQRTHPVFDIVRNAPEKGDFPGLFAYKCLRNQSFSVWGVLFWDRLIFTVHAHEPACPGCPKCTPPSESA